MKNVFPGLVLILLVSVSVFSFKIRLVRAGTITVPDDYATIQGAIDAASDGDTINVRTGIYYEHLIVNKTLTLVGENRDNTIIDGSYYGTVVEVTADDVSLSRLKIQHGEVGSDITGNRTVISSNAFAGNGKKTTEQKMNLEVFPEPPAYLVWRFLYDMIEARFTEVFQVSDEASAIKVKVSGHDDVSQLALALFYDANADGIPQFSEYTGYASRDKVTDVSLSDPPVGQYIIKVRGWDVTGSPGHFDREITTYRGYGLGVHSVFNCTVSGNVANDNYAGISLQSSSDIEVYGNDVNHNFEGIMAGNLVDSVFFNNTVSETLAGELLGVGFSVRDSDLVNLTENSVSSKAFGINLWNSSQVSVAENQVNSNAGWGIDLHSSSNNSVSNNRISYSAGLDGIRLMFSSDNLLSRNRISYSEHSGILLWYDCDNNMIVDNTIQRSGYQGWGHGHGAEVLFSSGNLFANNSISRNNHGIIVIEAPSNIFADNLVYSNSLGIQIKDASGNRVYHNNFLDNTDWQSLDEGGGNLWDDGYPSGGNYWSNLVGADQFGGPFQNVMGSDGIVDTAYPIEAQGIDHYPLMEPYKAAPMLGDLNGDKIVDIFDLVMVAVAFNSMPESPNWNQDADVNDDLSIDIFDLVVVALHFGETG
jgi:parallel beta-helix repeat protein